MDAQLFINVNAFPCQVIDIAQSSEKNVATIQRQLQNVPHEKLQPIVFHGVQYSQPIAIYEPIKVQNAVYAFSTQFPAETVEDAEFIALAQHFGLQRQLQLCTNRNPHGMPVEQLLTLVRQPCSARNVIVIDFELYEQTKEMCSISEVGACKVAADGTVTTMHAFIRPPARISNWASATYVQRKITGIPCKPTNTIEYYDYHKAICDLKQFIGDENVVFAKGNATETAALNYMGINVTVAEVYPFLCSKKGIRLFPNLKGQRCPFHAKLADKFHCALEDATEWAFEFSKK